MKVMVRFVELFFCSEWFRYSMFLVKVKFRLVSLV